MCTFPVARYPVPRLQVCSSESTEVVYSNDVTSSHCFDVTCLVKTRHSPIAIMATYGKKTSKGCYDLPKCWMLWPCSGNRVVHLHSNWPPQFHRSPAAARTQGQTWCTPTAPIYQRGRNGKPWSVIHLSLNSGRQPICEPPNVKSCSALS